MTLWRLFLSFAKIGAFTIGGGYAMIPLIQREMSSKGWILEEEFADVVAVAQSAPGVLAVNMAIFAGYRLRGVKGSLAAALGAVLPSFIIILLIASVLSSFKDNPVVASIFKGIRPAVVALIIVPAVNLSRKTNHRWWAWAITAAAAIAVAFLKVSAIWVLLVTAAVAFAVAAARQKKEGGV